MELFLLLPGPRSKNSFTRCYSFILRGSKLIFETENRIIQIIQTGNGIISPTSWPLIKKLLYKLFPIYSQELIFETGNCIIKTGNGIISPTYILH